MKKITLIITIISLLACSDNQANDGTVKQAKDKKQEVVEKAVEKGKEKVTVITKENFDENKQKTENIKDIVNGDKAKEEPAYQAGIHYEMITPAWDTQSDEVVVYEFFGYLCPHCNTFQPYIETMESNLPENAKLVRIPMIFQPMWKIYAQAYYTAESMGLTEKTHQKLFDAVHKQRKQFRTIEQIADWYADSFGVDRNKFLSTANSFVIDGQLRQSDKMMKAMGIVSTPTLVINGKYKAKKNALKTRGDLINLAEFLVDKELNQ